MGKYCCKWAAKDNDGRPYLVQECCDGTCKEVPGWTLISASSVPDDCKGCESKITSPPKSTNAAAGASGSDALPAHLPGFAIPALADMSQRLGHVQGQLSVLVQAAAQPFSLIDAGAGHRAEAEYPNQSERGKCELQINKAGQLYCMHQPGCHGECVLYSVPMGQPKAEWKVEEQPVTPDPKKYYFCRCLEL